MVYFIGIALLVRDFVQARCPSCHSSTVQSTKGINSTYNVNEFLHGKWHLVLTDNAVPSTSVKYLYCPQQMKTV